MTERPGGDSRRSEEVISGAALALVADAERYSDPAGLGELAAAIEAAKLNAVELSARAEDLREQSDQAARDAAFMTEWLGLLEQQTILPPDEAPADSRARSDYFAKVAALAAARSGYAPGTDEAERVVETMRLLSGVTAGRVVQTRTGEWAQVARVTIFPGKTGAQVCVSYVTHDRREGEMMLPVAELAKAFDDPSRPTIKFGAGAAGVTGITPRLAQGPKQP